jgi:hypothetical protein
MVVFDVCSVAVVFVFALFASSPSKKSPGSPSIAAYIGLITAAVIVANTINVIITTL